MASEAQIVQAILKQNEFMLRRHLVLSKTVLDQMKANGIITEVTKRKIMTEPAYEQVAILLKSMEHKGLLSLRKFLDVLRGTGHSWIVDSILDTDVTANANQDRTKDDIGYNDHFHPTHLRTHAQIPDINKRARFSLKPDLRKSVTAGSTNYGGQFDKGMSLGELLKAREPVDPEIAPRGMFNARSLLMDSIAGGAAYQDQFEAPTLQSPQYNHPLITYPRSKEEIPMALYGLNQAFSDQDQRNQQALSVLQQEEIAIKQLMEQNVRDQSNVRRKQAAVQDIAVRLRDIHNRATEVYGPTPHPNIGRYRLAQLNKIPWSIDG